MKLEDLGKIVTLEYFRDPPPVVAVIPLAGIIGRPANLLILSADSDYEVIRSQGLALYSIRNGKVLMKRQPAQVTFL